MSGTAWADLKAKTCQDGWLNPHRWGRTARNGFYGYSADNSHAGLPVLVVAVQILNVAE